MRARSDDTWLLDGLAVPASLHDVDGRFVHMNAAAEQALGSTCAEMLGRHFAEPVPPGARENVEAQFRCAVETGAPTHFDTVFVDAGGELRGVRAQQLPVLDGSEVVGVLILAFELRSPRGVMAAAEAPPRLTRRQREILALLADGLSTAEIAAELTLSIETVRNHLRRVLKELGAHTRVEAIAAANRLGLLAAPALGRAREDSNLRPAD